MKPSVCIELCVNSWFRAIPKYGLETFDTGSEIVRRWGFGWLFINIFFKYSEHYL